MTTDEFKSELSSKKDQLITIKDLDFSEEIKLENDIKSNGIVIKDCVFNQDLIFININLGGGIHFYDCTFNGAVVFYNCNAKKYNQPFNFFYGHIAFLKCTLKKDLLFNQLNNIERDIVIGKGTKISRLDIRSIVCRKGSLRIEGAEIQDLCDIRNSHFNSSIWISNNTVINTKARIENINTGAIVIQETNFNKDVFLWACNLNDLTFNGGEFKDDFNVQAVNITGQTTVFDSHFFKSLSINTEDKTNNKQGVVKKLYIKSGKFEEPFLLEGNNSKISNLQINFSRQIEGEMIFKNLTINQSHIGGDNHNANLIFNRCNFKQITFDNFFNYSGLTFSTCLASMAKGFSNKDTEFNALSSNFGSAQFFNLDLNSFEKIKLKDTIITEIIASNITWFDDDKLNPDDPKTIEFYNQKREIYRQIKFALENQGDKINSLDFKAKEMKAHKAKVFHGSKWPKPIRSKENFILWVGQTNNYGQNWIKAAGFALLFSMFFHFLIVVGISEEIRYCPASSINDLQSTWKVYSTNFNSLPMLMNPTHILTRIFPAVTHIGFWPHLFDYLQKIFMTFFIFQVVVAFRKFMK